MREANRNMDTLRRVAMVLLVGVAPVLAADSRPATQPRAQTIMLPMSDGVRLATDVILPPGKGPFPVVLMRTPYNKSRSGAGVGVALGYAIVSQDMRGRFASEGENLPFIGCGWADHRDGAETLEWTLKQPWCSSKVGTIGGSAGGITQNLLAGADPKGLTCQYITVAAASLYHHAAYVGGALRKSQVEGWLKSNRFDAKALELYAGHPTYDEFWRKFDSAARHAEMTAPAVHVGGWFDTFSQGTVASFVGRQHQGGPGARGTQKLVMGPWAHGRNPLGKVGDLTFPNSREPGRYGFLPWFDHYLKGKDNGADKLPAVAYYVMGDTADRSAPGNEWRYADDWPLPSKPVPYYLHADGKLSLSPAKPATAAPASGGRDRASGGGERAGGGEQAVEYTFDPANPCPTVGGNNLNLPAGPMDQARVEARKDVVTFTTGPLAEPLEITGHPKAVIHVASSAADTDLSVRFCDVYPDGKGYLMAEGMLRLRCREGFTKAPKPLTPHQAYEVTVDVWPTSIIINKGHRIRIAVTSSNYPRFDVNPGTGLPWSEGGKKVRQTNRIFCSPDRPSRIILPVVPPGK